MSTAVFSTSAALGRHFLFDAEPKEYCHPERSGKCAKRISRGVEDPALSLPKGSLLSPDPRLASITLASHLEIRPAPEMASTGIPALDALTGGLPRGCLTEICGPASSGRTSVMLAVLAAATHRGEYCAVLDASDSLDPNSVAASRVDLDRFLWVRCNENSPQRHRGTEKIDGTKFNGFVRGTVGKGTASAVPYGVPTDAALAAEGPRFYLQNSDEYSRNRKRSEHRLEQVLRVTDLLLESGGFGLIVLDLADLPWEAARRIPLTTWFRFRRAVENKPTILLATGQQPIAGSCSSLLLQLGVPSSNQSSADHRAVMQDMKPSHSQLLTELKINGQLIRSRLDRKPARSVAFETKTAWTG